MKIFEIGVGDYWQSRTLKYINTEHECWLFEPNPAFYKAVSEKLKEYKNFNVFNCAIGDSDKEVEFCLAGEASFINGIKAPFSNRGNFEKIKISVKSINDFDLGDIDVLLLDLEGGEFDVLKTMRSRPEHIVVEMQSFGVKYRNPNFDAIIEWMSINNYKKVNGSCPWPDVRGHSEEDFYFVKNCGVEQSGSLPAS
jgi:FkbM family methyltransferase